MFRKALLILISATVIGLLASCSSTTEDSLQGVEEILEDVRESDGATQGVADGSSTEATTQGVEVEVKTPEAPSEILDDECRDAKAAYNGWNEKFAKLAAHNDVLEQTLENGDGTPIEGWEGYFREQRQLISNQDEMRDLYDKAAYLVIDNKDCFPPEEVATYRAYLDK